jgi:hypothetical protein
MFVTSCTPTRLSKGLSHSFDPVSGWCLFGCGNREDGRITTRDGRIIDSGPSYSENELQGIFERVSNDGH